MDNLVCLFVKEGEIVIDLPFFYVVVNGLAGVPLVITVPEISHLLEVIHVSFIRVPTTPVVVPLKLIAL